MYVRYILYVYLLFDIDVCSLVCMVISMFDIYILYLCDISSNHRIFELKKFAFRMVLDSIVASILPCHGSDPGSIPGQGALLWT